MGFYQPPSGDYNSFWGKRGVQIRLWSRAESPRGGTSGPSCYHGSIIIEAPLSIKSCWKILGNHGIYDWNQPNFTMFPPFSRGFPCRKNSTPFEKPCCWSRGTPAASIGWAWAFVSEALWADVTTEDGNLELIYPLRWFSIAMLLYQRVSTSTNVSESPFRSFSSGFAYQK